MVVTRNGYKYVDLNSMRNIEINGNVYPLRENKKILKGEDIAFLLESIGERQYAGNGNTVNKYYCYDQLYASALKGVGYQLGRMYVDDGYVGTEENTLDGFLKSDIPDYKYDLQAKQNYDSDGYGDCTSAYMYRKADRRTTIDSDSTTPDTNTPLNESDIVYKLFLETKDLVKFTRSQYVGGHSYVNFGKKDGQGSWQGSISGSCLYYKSCRTALKSGYAEGYGTYYPDEFTFRVKSRDIGSLHGYVVARVEWNYGAGVKIDYHRYRGYVKCSSVTYDEENGEYVGHLSSSEITSLVQNIMSAHGKSIPSLPVTVQSGNDWCEESVKVYANGFFVCTLGDHTKWWS